MTAPAFTPLPGTIVDFTAAASEPGDPTDPSVLFLVGLTERGPLTPTETRSFAAWTAIYGDRDGNELVWDAADLFFRRVRSIGGGRLVTLRRAGEAAAAASVTLVDAAEDDAVVFAAVDVGEAGNAYAVTVAEATGDGVKVTVLRDGAAVEVWDDLATVDAIVAALARSAHLRATDAGSGELPDTTTATALTGGTDDRDNVDDTTLPADLARIPRHLGIGQLSVAGAGTLAAWTAMLDHAGPNNRYALLDVPAGATAAVVAPLRQQIADHPHARAGETYVGEGWVLPPARFGEPPRTVVASAGVAAAMAVTFARLGHTIHAAAGAHGRIPEATDVALPLDPQEWTDAYAARINPLILETRGRRVAQVYGIRTVTDDPGWRWNTWSRSAMWLQSRLEVAGSEFEFGEAPTTAKIDRFKARLLGELDRDDDAGAFNDVGVDEDTPRYDVDVTVTTSDVIAAGQLIGAVTVTWAGATEQVVIPVTMQPIA